MVPFTFCRSNMELPASFSLGKNTRMNYCIVMPIHEGLVRLNTPHIDTVMRLMRNKFRSAWVICMFSFCADDQSRKVRGERFSEYFCSVTVYFDFSVQLLNFAFIYSFLSYGYYLIHFRLSHSSVIITDLSCLAAYVLPCLWTDKLRKIADDLCICSTNGYFPICLCQMFFSVTEE